MICIKTDEEIELIKQGAQILAEVHGLISKKLKRGITTLELDKLAYDYITSKGAYPSFLGYGGFPNSLCISINEELIHGIPSKRKLEKLDIVSIDCGVYYKGFHSDSAFTYFVDDIENKYKELLKITYQSLFYGIKKYNDNHKIGDVGYAIQRFVEKHGYKIVKKYVGHGVGKDLHEDPEVPNFGKPNSGPKIKSNIVVAIEPMVACSLEDVHILSDKWTVVSSDNLPTAHYEHTVTFNNNCTKILTKFDYIEDKYLKLLS